MGLCPNNTAPQYSFEDEDHQDGMQSSGRVPLNSSAGRRVPLQHNLDNLNCTRNSWMPLMWVDT